MGHWCNNKLYTCHNAEYWQNPKLKKKKMFTTCLFGPEVSFAWKLVTDIRMPVFIIFFLTQFFHGP